MAGTRDIWVRKGGRQGRKVVGGSVSTLVLGWGTCIRFLTYRRHTTITCNVATAGRGKTAFTATCHCDNILRTTNYWKVCYNAKANVFSPAPVSS